MGFLAFHYIVWEDAMNMLHGCWSSVPKMESHSSTLKHMWNQSKCFKVEFGSPGRAGLMPVAKTLSVKKLITCHSVLVLQLGHIVKKIRQSVSQTQSTWQSALMISKSYLRTVYRLTTSGSLQCCWSQSLTHTDSGMVASSITSNICICTCLASPCKLYSL